MFQDKKQKVNKKVVKDFNITYGFLNRGANKSLFIQITSWLTVTNENINNYSEIFDRLTKKIKQEIYNDATYFDKNFYLVNLGVRKTGLVVGSKTYFDLEITLFSKHKPFTPSDKLDENINRTINKVIESVLTKNSNFKFNHKK